MKVESTAWRCVLLFFCLKHKGVHDLCGEGTQLAIKQMIDLVLSFVMLLVVLL